MDIVKDDNFFDPTDFSRKGIRKIETKDSYSYKNLLFFIFGALTLGLILLLVWLYREHKDHLHHNHHNHHEDDTRLENRYAIYLDNDDLDNKPEVEKEQVIDKPPFFRFIGSLVNSNKIETIGLSSKVYAKFDPTDVDLNVYYRENDNYDLINSNKFTEVEDFYLDVYDSFIGVTGKIDGNYKALMYTVNDENKLSLIQDVSLSQKPKHISITNEYMCITLEDSAILLRHGVIDYDFHNQILPIESKINKSYIAISSSGVVYIMKRQSLGHYVVENTIIHNDPSFGKHISMNDRYLCVQDDRRLFLYSLSNLNIPEFELNIEALDQQTVKHDIAEDTLVVWDSSNVYTYWVTSKKKWVLGKVWNASNGESFKHVKHAIDFTMIYTENSSNNYMSSLWKMERN